jgi:Rrf2 family protein
MRAGIEWGALQQAKAGDACGLAGVSPKKGRASPLDRFNCNRYYYSIKQGGPRIVNSEFTIAVHSLVYLAYLPDKMASSDLIAENVGTHSARVRKVMSGLRKSGYVDTREGSGGGYRLMIDPAVVTLADVYRVMAQGSLIPSWCSGDPGMDCVVGSNMNKVMFSIFCTAEKKLEEHFGGITINDVLGQIQACDKVQMPNNR